ncbi:MAG TPA: hypothetical protein VGD43_01280, partial [Micromonospora sp.]
RAPLLVLGQPGSGKSVLTKALAARLPAADFLVVRVVLREVSAVADLQEQIEQAVRADTGERLEWPTLVRSAGDALPVVLLDGFDELLQATGVSQTDYLLRVAAFQRREADQGRPVAVLVTSRTSVADRAQPPPGTVALRLEPFDEARVACWLDTWNAVNADRFAVLGVEPLDPGSALRHRELAEQPLLLLMLALYDADGNALRGAGELRQGELYERLLRSFARREVTKHRELSNRDLDRAVEAELRRLAVVAFAMFNRRAQWVTEEELEHDLAVLLGGAPEDRDRGGRWAPLRAAQVVLGRFFFIHRAQASPGDGRRLETYEFLHATFGEFLVARLTWQVVADLVAREAASSMSFGGGPADDDLLHALLSHAVLSDRAPVLTFLTELMSTLDGERRAEWAEVLVRLFHEVHETARGRRFDDYRPRGLPVPARYAVHSANLLLLAVCAAGSVTGRQLYPARSYPEFADPVGPWHRQALLWRSQLAHDEWTSLVDRLDLDRRRDDQGRDIVLSILPNGLTLLPPPVDTEWTYGLARFGPRGDAEAFWAWPEQGPTDESRSHFECGQGDDLIQHVLEPVRRFCSTPVHILAVRPDGISSVMREILEVCFAPIGDLPAEERARTYQNAMQLALSPPGTANRALREQVTALVFDRMAADDQVPPWLVVRLLNLASRRSVLSKETAGSFLRCCLSFLGRDPETDPDLRDVTERITGVVGPGWSDRTVELAAEVTARLADLGLYRSGNDIPDVEQLANRLTDLLAGRRPDLAARLRPLR